MWAEWIHQKGFKYPDENIIRFIARNYADIERSKLKVLVNGFASGRHVIFFAKEGFNTYGIDKEKTALKNVKTWLQHEKLDAKVQQADALRSPFKKDFFDIILDFGMIEHFTFGDRVKAFQQISNVLKKNGVFIFIAKNITDHYYAKGEKIEKNTFIVNTPYLKNIPTHFYAKKDLLGELRPYFKKVNLECLEQLRDNLKVRLSNWYAFCFKQ